MRLQGGEGAAVFSGEDEAQAVQQHEVGDVDEEGRLAPVCYKAAEAGQMLLAEHAYAQCGGHPQQHERTALHRRVKSPPIDSRQQRQSPQDGHPSIAAHESGELIPCGVAANQEPCGVEAERQYAFVEPEGQPGYPRALVVCGGFRVGLAEDIARGEGEEDEPEHGFER